MNNISSTNTLKFVFSTLLFLCAFCITSIICNNISFAASPAPPHDTDIQVRLQADESLRQISERLLGDKDAWQLILRYNGIDHPDTVTTGTFLRVPVTLYTNLNHHLEQSATLIGKAHKEGAKLLANKEITQAHHLRDNALHLKNQAHLQKALQQAKLAEQEAQKALTKAKKTQRQSTEAWLAAKSGTVQNRKPGASRWQRTKLQQKLQEREKVRTLADSRCIIKFSDQSLLSLEEHALVVIGTMEKNIIRSSYTNNVSMFKGDILIHLASLSRQKQFTLNLPNITTNVRSRHFFTSRDKKNITRISNYDGEIDIKAEGGQVTVKKNQGTKVVPGHQPTAPKKLLPPPRLLVPLPAQKLYGAEPVLTWKAVAGAQRYLIEISRKNDFTDFLLQEEVSQQNFLWKVEQSGIYFFRIKTIDQDECSGPYSEPVPFFVDLDAQAPFLALHYPFKNIITAKDHLIIRGEVEQNASLRINDQEIHPDKNGYFQHKLFLDDYSPSNTHKIIHIKAVDAAGNTSTIERRVTLMQKKGLIQLHGPENIISNTKEIVISGQLLPHVRLQVDEKTVQAKGTFTHLLVLDEGEHTVVLNAVSPDGQTEKRSLHIFIDLHPPEIHINDIPQMTASSELTLTGTLSEKARITLNGKKLQLSGKSFSNSVSLTEGKNKLLLIAKDTAGNQGKWQASVLYDQQAPKVVTNKLSPSVTKGGEIIQLAAQIEDDGVGVAQSGSFIVKIHDEFFKGTLKSTGKKPYNFAGSVFIHPGISGQIQVQDIQIQDMLGNSTRQP